MKQPRMIVSEPVTCFHLISFVLWFQVFHLSVMSTSQVMVFYNFQNTSGPFCKFSHNIPSRCFITTFINISN
jgi:hypothetical protein